jgi:peptide/nickel transport system substrate-binding protein
MLKKIAIILMIGLLGLGAFAGGSVETEPSKQTAPVESKYGGVLRIIDNFKIANLGYPPIVQQWPELRYASPCLESLTRLDETGIAIPWLAESWEVAKDLRSITFKLRKGVKFHDGTDFNATAAKWNMDNWIASGRAQLKEVTSVDILDDYTVKFNFSEFSNIFWVDLSTFAGTMISPTAYEKNGEDWVSKHPVGTGPFKFVSWERDVRLVYERFDDYWQEGKPYLDGIEWVFIAEPLTALAAYLAGEAEVIPLSPKDVADVEKKGHKIVISEMESLRGIAFDAGQYPDGPFGDIRVRQAVCHAINTQEIVDTIGMGYWQVTNQIARPGMWAYNPDVVGYPYNPDKARKLLAEAGYPNGFKTKLGLLDLGPEMVLGFTAAQAFLKEVGIEAELDVMDRGRYNQHNAGGAGYEGMFSLTNGLAAGELRLLQNAYSGWTPFWSMMLHPPEYQKVLQEAIVAPDFETMKAKVHQAEKMIVDEYCMAFPFWLHGSIYAMSPKLHDFTLSQAGGTTTAHEAWLSK